MRRIVGILIALTVLLGMSSAAFAAVGGYASSPIGPAPVTEAQITAAVAAAIGQGTGGAVRPTLNNVSTVAAAALRSAFTQAAAAGVTGTVIQLDTRQGNVVLSRVYVDFATAARLSGTVDLSAYVSGRTVTNAVNTFETFFDNTVIAVTLGQPGAFGAYINMAARVDLSGLNTDTLTFFVYDRDTNTFSRITPEFRIDSAGYLHFSTPLGGDIIISDKPLTRKESISG